MKHTDQIRERLRQPITNTTDEMGYLELTCIDLCDRSDELLEALELMVARFGCRTNNLFSQRSAVNMATAAISKAKGES